MIGGPRPTLLERLSAWLAGTPGKNQDAISGLCGLADDDIAQLHERINALERRLQETHDIAIQALARAANPIPIV